MAQWYDEHSAVVMRLMMMEEVGLVVVLPPPATLYRSSSCYWWSSNSGSGIDCCSNCHCDSGSVKESQRTLLISLYVVSLVKIYFSCTEVK